jgi:hypothetical protein
VDLHLPVVRTEHLKKVDPNCSPLSFTLSAGPSRTFLGAVPIRSHVHVEVSHTRAALSSPPVSIHFPSELL